jgi:hypothetical protein
MRRDFDVRVVMCSYRVVVTWVVAAFVTALLVAVYTLLYKRRHLQ